MEELVDRAWDAEQHRWVYLSDITDAINEAASAAMLLFGEDWHAQLIALIPTPNRPSLICPVCKIDRFRDQCPNLTHPDCPIVGYAVGPSNQRRS